MNSASNSESADGGTLLNLSGVVSVINRKPTMAMACCVLASWMFLRTAAGQTPVDNEEFKLVASDAAQGDQFGEAVCINGDVALVGSPGHDDFGGDSGAAYVYRFDGIKWVEEAKLTASDAGQADSFGLFFVSIQGDVALIGAIGGDSGKTSDSGAAYVFRFDGANWGEEVKLTASDAATGDSFGWSVALSGNVAVIGAPDDDDGGENAGSAYVFRYDGINWAQDAKLPNPDPAINDRYGDCVAISGNVIVIGVPGDTDADSGSAYVFRFDGIGTWNQEKKLTASDAAFGDNFGHDLSVDDDVAVVVGGSAAYVYRYNEIDWLEEAKLIASDGEAGDKFGRSVSISGNAAVIGSPRDDDAGSDSGSAYVYRFDGTSWMEEAKLIASDGDVSDNLGWSISVRNDVVLAGAFHDDLDGLNDSGSAYIFLLFPLDGEARWMNPAGGCFSDPNNWDFPVPGLPNSAVFDLGLDPELKPYVVTFDGDVVNVRLRVLSDNVKFNLNGFTYRLDAIDQTAVIVGDLTDDNGNLTVINGVLDSDSAAIIGNEAGSFGHVAVSGALATRMMTEESESSTPLITVRFGIYFSAFPLGRRGEMDESRGWVFQ